MTMKIVALSGGVGGAKMVDGLAQILPPGDLTVVVNTGDDFEHFGLTICPDLDTICYMLAGIANPETGWGYARESWHVLENIKKLGGPDWFRLGDKDLATHLERSRLLREGQKLSQITSAFCRRWDIKHTILPMSDEPVRTIVDTIENGEMAFQDYFVKCKCKPKVKGFRFAGLEAAKPAPGVLEALGKSDAIIICLSNPWLSIDPIVAILDLFPTPLHSHSPPIAPEGMKGWRGGVSCVAISPIIGGRTVKGPAAKICAEMGIQPSALAVAQHYGSRLTHFVLDKVDQLQVADVENMGIKSLVTDTMMKTTKDRRRLAQDVLNFIQAL